MELDFSREWHIIGPRGGSDGGDPAGFAARELSEILGRMIGRGSAGGPKNGDGSEAERIIVLDSGTDRASRGFSWRAASDRVEIFGANGGALLRGVYDFLACLGARWVEPGEKGERLPRGEILRLSESSRSSEGEGLPSTLILGHGVLLEGWEDRLAWAARAGYSSVFVHTTPDALAMGAAPESLYESLRAAIGPLARKLGLELELGGHGLSSLLPRSLFEKEPGLFRMREGRRDPDRNLCPSSAEALAIIAEAFAARATAHPEVAVFHAWPDDLPGGGWCSCPACSALSPAAQSLKVARALAGALSSARTNAALAFLAYHDTEDTGSCLEGGERLPPNLELLWAPRLRCWGSSLSEGGDALNAASIAAFRRTARAWRAAGGGRVSVFEYWEDAVLFKGAVPPLVSVMEGDLAAYRGPSPEEGADAVGILCAGGRVALGPRPNLALLPGLASRISSRELLADWAGAAYGAAAEPMLEYWRELEAAWAIDLDLEEGETAIHVPDSRSRYAADPPADWGDPWTAGAPRLEAKRGRCEELFDHLRRAEARLSAARASIERSEESADSREAAAVRGEASEYAISGAVLELDCARLSAYHELAAGNARAAADIANLALSASGAVRKALRCLPDKRQRREIGLLITLYYDLRLRMIRRANARSGLRRLMDLWLTGARTGLAALGIMRAYVPKAIAPRRPRR